MLLDNRDDDAAAERMIIRHCQRSPRRVVIAPAAGFHCNRELAIQVHIALGAPAPPQFPYSWLTQWQRAPQLELFPEQWADTRGGEQLSLFPAEDARWERWRYLTRHDFQLADAADLMRVVDIAELYVLQAQALSSGTWERLRWLAEAAQVRLHLVLSGNRARPLLRRALRGCRVRQWSLRNPRARPSLAWWSRRSYQAETTAGESLPERFVRPIPTTPFECFRAAALAAMRGDDLPGAQERSFIGLRPTLPPPQRPPISGSRLAMALSRALARQEVEEG